MRIRPYAPEDVASIGHVHATSRRSAYVDLVPGEALARVTPDFQADYWRTRLTRAPEPHRLLVLDDAGAVAGFVLGSGAGGIGTLHALHVLPGLHGSGAGRALHERMLEAFDAWCCAQAELWVLDGNERAQAFYRRNGWTHDGKRSTNDIGGAAVPILRYTRPVGSPARSPAPS